MQGDFNRIVDDIMANIRIDGRAVLHSIDNEGDLISLHSTFGRHIRNTYGLWSEEGLVERMGFDHPDTASSAIMKIVWEKVREGKDAKV